MYELELHFTKSFVVRALNRYWLRLAGIPFIVLYVGIAAIILLFILGGERSWLIGLAVGVWGFMLLIFFVLYVNQYRISVKKFKHIKVENINFRFDETVFSHESASGKSELNWSIVDKVWRFPECWLVFVGSSQFFTLPVADLTQEVQDNLMCKFQELAIEIA